MRRDQRWQLCDKSGRRMQGGRHSKLAGRRCATSACTKYRSDIITVFYNLVLH